MIRKYLIAGFVTLLPSVVTFWILRAIFTTLVDVFRAPAAWMASLLHMPVPPAWGLALISAAATLCLLFLAGALVGNFVGRQILGWLDDIVMHVPLVKGIYGATKQLMSAIQNGQGGSFKEVVLVEWPREGSWTLAFVANRDCAWTRGEDAEALVAVYIPTAPNPTSGYVVMVPASRIRPTEVTPDQALTWAVSGGVVTPAGKQP
ncbi:DUF502 domain-containing protein [Mesoterricola sediminis]|uniref:Membrane protein n=1 Tax=Mesoterricola sediminis TaxID=2927980 RepID=A0AA48GYP3_9BACT|nr:DUF502 domain-containing protein [Mesoterricola sediminis]BDU76472.1 membrane protein [Mesoterricola sediminis]